MPIREDLSHRPAPGPEPRRTGEWIRGHAYLIGFGLLSLVLGIIVLRKRPMTEFEWVFVLTARHLMDGRGIYELSFPPFRSFTYPPFMAVLGVPFALLPPRTERVAWYLVNVTSLFVFWRVAWRLTGGGRLEGTSLRVDRREHVVACLGLAGSLPYLLSVLDHQQTDILIAALLVVGIRELRGSRAWGAATCFGLASAMKCTPLLWAPYLAMRGRWRSAAWVVAFAVGINLLADVFSRPEGGGTWLAVWCSTFLKPMARPDFMPGTWHAWILDNQSLAGTVNRWVTTRLALAHDGLAVIAAPPLMGPQALRPLVAMLEGSLILAAWYVLRRRSDEPSGQGAPTRLALESSVVLLLMLLLSPMSSRTHFGTMLVPCLCLARVATYNDSRAVRWLLYASLATGLTTVTFLPRSVARLSMWCGMLTWSAVFLLIGCAWVFHRGTGTAFLEAKAAERQGRASSGRLGLASDLSETSGASSAFEEPRRGRPVGSP